MTRAERLAQTAARAKEALAQKQHRLAQVQSAQRAEERKTRTKRQLAVGKLVDHAGLLVLDDTTLAGLFGLLTPLTQVPTPVAVLEALLCDPERPALASVDGMALPVGKVSARCADLAKVQ